jgi:hypothetical protein
VSHPIGHARGADSVLYRAKLLVVSRVGAVGRAEFKVWTGPPGTLSTGRNVEERTDIIVELQKRSLKTLRKKA